MTSFPDAAPISIIDAVDECGSEGRQTRQRKLFIDSLTQWSSLPIPEKTMDFGPLRSFRAHEGKHLGTSFGRVFTVHFYLDLLASKESRRRIFA
jgi:hypothetical protein